MLEVLFQPKPWLDLFQTDFVYLRNLREQELQTVVRHHDSAQDETLLSDSEYERPLVSSGPPLNSIVLSLPSEVLHKIFSHLEPEQLATAAQVCNRWLAHAYEPHHWRRIARRTWPSDSSASLERMLYNYKTWRKLATQRPRLRTNAIYVTRHQFAKTSCRTAVSEPRAPVFLVTYYRFLRFYPDGTIVALTTPEPPESAYKRLRRTWTPSHLERDKAFPSIGQYELDECNMQVRISLPMSQPKFPNMRSGTMYMQFALASTAPGACNRLYLNEHYAIMDHDGGDLISYNPAAYGNKPYRLVPLYGFKSHVYKEFPLDDHYDLAQWYEMKRASRTGRRNKGVTS